MTDEKSRALVLLTLERAAERLGDIAPLVMARFYAACPRARERFDYHDPVDRPLLEGQMVAQTLYALLAWFEPGNEIEIMLTSTIPHHVETLDVGQDLFVGLLDAVCAVVGETVPERETTERAAWNDLRAQIVAFARQEFASLQQPLGTARHTGECH